MITYIVILCCVQHFAVSSTLLCPELYSVQHITVSNTLLCQAKYCVHAYPKDLLSTYHISTCCVRIICLRSTSVVMIQQQTWPSWAILVSDWLIQRRCFSTETARAIETKLNRRHLCKVPYRKIIHFYLIQQQTYSPWAIPISYWLIQRRLFFSET